MIVSHTIQPYQLCGMLDYNNNDSDGILVKYPIYVEVVHINNEHPWKWVVRLRLKSLHHFVTVGSNA